MDKIVVQVDAELQDLVPGYMENRKRDIFSIRDALGRADYETIRIAGHSMKGSGGGYGFEEITQIGARIETAAKVADTQAILRAVEDLHHYLQQLEVVFV